MAVNSFNAQNPPVTTKGDVFTFSTIPTRLGVGANNTVLTADSTAATGLKWATPSAGGYTELASGSFSGSNLSLTSISASYKDLRVLIRGIRGSAGESPRIRFNNDTTNGNYRQGTNLGALASSAAISFAPEFITGGSTIANINIDVLDYTNTSTHKPVWARSYYQDGATPSYRAQINQGAWLNTGAINRIDIFFDSGNSFTGGTYILYGVN